MPAEFEGHRLVVLSVGSETLSVLVADVDQQALRSVIELAALLGLDVSTLRVAAASDPTRSLAADGEGAERPFVLFATRVEGLTPGTIELTHDVLSLQPETDMVLEKATLSGREVWRADRPDEVAQDAWFYVVEDVLLAAQAAERSLARELVDLLPPGPELP